MALIALRLARPPRERHDRRRCGARRHRDDRQRPDGRAPAPDLADVGVAGADGDDDAPPGYGGHGQEHDGLVSLAPPARVGSEGLRRVGRDVDDAVVHDRVEPVIQQPTDVDERVDEPRGAVRETGEDRLDAGCPEPHTPALNVDAAAQEEPPVDRDDDLGLEERKRLEVGRSEAVAEVLESGQALVVRQGAPRVLQLFHAEPRVRVADVRLLGIAEERVHQALPDLFPLKWLEVVRRVFLVLRHAETWLSGRALHVEQYASLRRRDREKPQHKANDMRPQACHENASVFTHASPVLGAGSRLRR